MNVLVIDDEPTVIECLKRMVVHAGMDVVTVTSAKEAKALAAQKLFHIVILDIYLQDGHGTDLMMEMKRLPSYDKSDFILITGNQDIDLAIQSFRLGAYDFVTKPIEAEPFIAILNRSQDHQELVRENEVYTKKFTEAVESAAAKAKREYEEAKKYIQKLSGIGTVVAASKQMRQALAVAQQCHENPDIPVLVEGETGTGKEVVSRLIHFGRAGSDRPFVAISCSAIPHDLIESELFGYEEGSFTGALNGGATGKLLLARDGTVLFDDISDMPLPFQAKILRVLQERTFYSVGGAKRHDFKARVIATSNRSLEQLVEQKEFRRDLLHRIRYAHITIPPLRERIEDIESLALAFLRRESKIRKKSFTAIAPNAMAVLRDYPWPGNVRELEASITRVVLCDNAEVVESDHLSFLGNGGSNHGTLRNHGEEGDTTIDRLLAWMEAGHSVDDLVKSLVKTALDRLDGNQSKAATLLGVSRHTIRVKSQS